MSPALQGDAVVAWESPGVSAVVFPTGGTLPAAMQVAGAAKLCVMVNPQWTTGGIESGTFLSDFGFGEQRVRIAEKR